MDLTKDIRIEAYDYDLPDAQIARYPLEERSASRLLIYRRGEISEQRFADVTELLPEGTVLVRNNSRVIRARLLMQRETGAQIEIFCLDPSEPTSYELALGAHPACSWHCMLGNARRWRTGTSLTERLEGTPEAGAVVLTATRGEGSEVHFAWDNSAYTFGDILTLKGILPIPPYLARPTEERDSITYQTVYARPEGSVAAPTAGLHFTPEIFEQLEARGVEVVDLTLHVGAGTFRPVKSETIGEHEMHQELIVLSRETIERLRDALGHIVAVGTTSVRTLESLYHLGRSLMKAQPESIDSLTVGQWVPYDGAEMPVAADALTAVLEYMQRAGLVEIAFRTGILIAPGYTFRMVRGLITNFHQPSSTLLLLISAFVGEDWRRIYDYALAEGFRFLSYGDSSLLLPEG